MLLLLWDLGEVYLYSYTEGGGVRATEQREEQLVRQPVRFCLFFFHETQPNRELAAFQKGAGLKLLQLAILLFVLHV